MQKQLTPNEQKLLQMLTESIEWKQPTWREKFLGKLLKRKPSNEAIRIKEIAEWLTQERDFIEEIKKRKKEENGLLESVEVSEDGETVTVTFSEEFRAMQKRIDEIKNNRPS